MIFKLIFLILSLFNSSFGQSLNCSYSNSYWCSITINNPQGFDNFTSIGGTHVAGKNDTHVTYIQTSSGISKNIPAIICEQFPNVVDITLEGLKIEILTERSFAGCRVLKYLQLWNNKINTPPVNLLVNNPLLEVFRVFSNNIVDAIPEGIFDSTPNLNFFCHEGNPTGKFLPQLFRNLTKMDELHIDTMNLNEFSNCLLRPMVDLRYLRVYGNKLRVLHQKSFPPTKNKLVYMWFNDNLLEAVDRRIFDDTPSLMTVDFYNNFCTNLRTDNFNANRTANLAALEPCFAEYDRRFLNVNGNSSGSTCNFIQHPIYGYTCELINYDPKVPIINDHPDCLSDSDIKGLIFTNSTFSDFPSNIFTTFPNVEYVEAVDVGLQSAYIQNCGEKLKFFDASRNLIKDLPSYSFNCTNIETILVDHNMVTSIQPCKKSFIENLTKLKFLGLKGAVCYDGTFDLLFESMDKIKEKLKKCFGWWYMN